MSRPPDDACHRALHEGNFLPVCDELPEAPWCPDIIYEILDSPSIHRLCAGGDPLLPIQIIACVRTAADGTILEARFFPPDKMVSECEALGADWGFSSCYCCCNGYGDAIEAPDGVREARTLAPGESVMAGFPSRGRERIDWRPLPVAFSEGIAPGPGDRGVGLILAGRQAIACCADRPLMLAEGVLARAGSIRAGDQLMRPDGSAARVEGAVAGVEVRAHYVGTAAPALDGDGRALLDGHLIAAGGVVAGDYLVQLHFEALPPEARARDIDDRREAGPGTEHGRQRLPVA
jgi:hypothetical protein